MEQAHADRILDHAQPAPHRVRLGLARAYAIVLVSAALVMLWVLVYAQRFWPGLHPSGSFPWTSFVVLLILALFAEAYTIQVAPRMDVSAGFLASFLTAAIAGPLASFALAVVSQLPTLRERHYEHALTFSATMGIVAGGISLIYWAALSLVGGFEQAPSIVVAAVGLGAGVLYQVLNLALVLPNMWLKLGIGPVRAWREGVKPILKFDLFFLVVSVGLISIYHLFLPKTGGAADYSATLLVLLCLVPVVALVWALRQWAVERMLAQGNERLARRNERLALQAVASQVTALDLKDNYTARHSASVAQWARDIAQAMGLSESDQNLTHLAGVLHDVGKIGVPDQILKSPSRLDADNWILIERHCENGYKVLRTIDQFEDLATVVLHHHEHYDGNGYPRQLVGEDIPLLSRIICVADSYSAMTSNRPYGPPLSTEVAMAELEYKKESQFDPKVVDVFLGLLAGRDEAYQRGTDVDFETEVHRIRFLHDLPVDMREIEGQEDASSEDSMLLEDAALSRAGAGPGPAGGTSGSQDS